MTAIIIIFALLFIAWCIIRAGAQMQAHNDELRRKEYQRMQDVKGGQK